MSNADLTVIRDLPIGWLLYVVAVWTMAIAVILLAVVHLGPGLWREGRLWVRLVLTPDKRDQKRRRELDAAAIGKRA